MRIRILLEYLKDTEAGKIPVDHDIERQISSLCNRLPVVNTKEFNAEFLKVRKSFMLDWEGLRGRRSGALNNVQYRNKLWIC